MKLCLKLKKIDNEAILKNSNLTILIKKGTELEYGNANNALPFFKCKTKIRYYQILWLKIKIKRNCLLKFEFPFLFKIIY